MLELVRWIAKLWVNSCHHPKVWKASTLVVMTTPHMSIFLAPFLQNAKSLASALSTDHNLTFLHLPQCSIDLDAFAEMLGKNHTITYLNWPVTVQHWFRRSMSVCECSMHKQYTANIAIVGQPNRFQRSCCIRWDAMQKQVAERAGFTRWFHRWRRH